jgi:predicted nuclease of predicted toxin-antitoxin system
MKILIDMNLSPRWVASLASHGIEAVHWSRVGAANAMDSEIIEFANKYNYAILTHDLDFSTMLAVRHLNKPSLIQLRTGDISPDSAVPLVIDALRQASAEIEMGAILTIELNKARLRILPLYADKG